MAFGKRDLVISLNHFMDQWVPPAIRDSKWLTYLPMRVLFKEQATTFETFKDAAFGLSPKHLADVYQTTAVVTGFQGPTDLNHRCLVQILKSIKGKTILDAGCGRGYLASLISQNFAVTGCDINLDPKLKTQYPTIKFVKANLTKLPFANKDFDTVICAHTLEHVPNIFAAIRELRRVTRKRLIVIVPKQRPYHFTFSLHLHFFPYRWSFETYFGHHKSSRLFDFGDWVYIEDQ